MGAPRHLLTIRCAARQVRFVLLPLAFGTLLTGATRSGLLSPDPLRDFVLLMQSAMPPAQNTVLALQIAGEPPRYA